MILRFFTVFGMMSAGWAAEYPKAPVPPSPYMPLIYRCADTMLEHGRDVYGPQKTGLFLSALDRKNLAPLTNRPAAPTGIRESDRVAMREGALTGANPQHDENLLRVLYTLSELSGKPKYREAADAELKWFLENTSSTNTHLLPWGEHMSWNAVKDAAISADGSENGTHEFFRPWMLWERCFTVAPEASKQFAIALWEHQIADHETGAFNRHTGFFKHAVQEGMDSPRHAGFYIRTWAMAYARTQDERFLHAIDVLLTRFEKKRDPKTGLIEEYAGSGNSRLASALSLAIDCDGASHYVPQALASRLREFAAREDEVFCAMQRNAKLSDGFITEATRNDGRPTGNHTSLWDAHYGENTTAQVAMMCVSRYDNTGRIGYRELITGAADAYLNVLPGRMVDGWPGTFGQAISLELAAWRHTARQIYLDRARQLADIAVERFFGNNPLPRASFRSDQYESITGADTLLLGLLELHLNILHITAVRCPPNTIDR